MWHSPFHIASSAKKRAKTSKVLAPNSFASSWSEGVDGIETKHSISPVLGDKEILSIDTDGIGLGDAGSSPGRRRDSIITQASRHVRGGDGVETHGLDGDGVVVREGGGFQYVAESKGDRVEGSRHKGGGSDGESKLALAGVSPSVTEKGRVRATGGEEVSRRRGGGDDVVEDDEISSGDSLRGLDADGDSVCGIKVGEYW